MGVICVLCITADGVRLHAQRPTPSALSLWAAGSSSSRYKFIIESSGARYKTMHMVEALSCLGNLFVCAVCVYSLASVSEWMRGVRARLPWCMHACTLYETVLQMPVHLPKSVIIDFWHGIHTVSRRQLHYFFSLVGVGWWHRLLFWQPTSFTNTLGSSNWWTG